MTTSARVTAGTVPATELDEVPPPRGEDDGGPGPDGARPPRPAPALPRDADGRYQVSPGGEFYAWVCVDDTRTDIGEDGGVFAAYADLTSNLPAVADWRPSGHPRASRGPVRRWFR